MKKSAKKYFILYISLCLFALSLITVMSGCAIQSIINAAQSAATNGIKPKWDVDLNVPILSKSVSLRDVFEDGSIVSDMLSGMQGASFDPVTAEDLAEGGKYYYPDENCFGLRQGDYVINYKIDFPGTENMLNGTINDSMIDQFINNFELRERIVANESAKYDYELTVKIRKLVKNGVPDFKAQFVPEKEKDGIPLIWFAAAEYIEKDEKDFCKNAVFMLAADAYRQYVLDEQVKQ